MSEKCEQLHIFFNGLKAHSYPFNENEIPKNGIYVQFEKGETGHGGNRIVRIGTHTGTKSSLKDRLGEHFEDFKRSVFRRKVGAAIIGRDIKNGSRLWLEDDLTIWIASDWHKRKERFRAKGRIDTLAEIEKQVSRYIRSSISFVCIDVKDLESRARFESGLISTVSNCAKCGPSKNWLGNFSATPKVCQSGLWQEKELWKDDLTDNDIDFLKTMIT